ncbi:hypothetical protein BDV93DRAFT_561013 [Ceratobasidium sp. AG-I]|nr:hypothetical protein BDV93DRAFT_561013 [Ceratobasidium sp. AG-I]
MSMGYPGKPRLIHPDVINTYHNHRVSVYFSGPDGIYCLNRGDGTVLRVADASHGSQNFPWAVPSTRAQFFTLGDDVYQWISSNDLEPLRVWDVLGQTWKAVPLFHSPSQAIDHLNFQLNGLEYFSGSNLADELFAATTFFQDTVQQETRTVTETDFEMPGQASQGASSNSTTLFEEVPSLISPVEDSGLLEPSTSSVAQAAISAAEGGHARRICLPHVRHPTRQEIDKLVRELNAQRRKSGQEYLECPCCGARQRRPSSLMHHLYFRFKVPVFRCLKGRCRYTQSTRTNMKRHVEKCDGSPKPGANWVPRCRDEE